MAVKHITLLLIQKVKQIKEEMDTDAKLKVKLDSIQLRINQRHNRFS